MPLPDDFSEWEHLREQITIAHNLQAERTFLGVEAGDINSTLGSMRQAVFIKDDDTVDMIVLRLFLYHFKFLQDLPTPVFATPITDFQSEITYKPQVILIFQEDANAFLLENNLPPTRAEISFRLMNYTPQTIDQAVALGVAEKIEGVFAAGTGFSWMKGIVKVVYRNLSEGLFLQIFAESAGEGQRVVEAVLEVSGHAFEQQHFSFVTREVTYPAVPSQIEVYGKSVKGVRKRPTTRVRFRKAELHVYGLHKPIILVDRTRQTHALVNTPG